MHQRLKDLTHLINTKHTQLWMLNLRVPGAHELAAARKLLCADELNHLNSIKNTTQKNEFALCRAACKSLLASYLRKNEKRLVFDYTEHGKPFLKDSAVHFNVSHSHERALIVLSLYPVGVDLEYIDPFPHSLEELDVFASPDEKHWVLAENTQQRFYILWTLKEALLKCKGEGFRAHSVPALTQTATGWSYPHHIFESHCLKENSYVCAIAISLA